MDELIGVPYVSVPSVEHRFHATRSFDRTPSVILSRSMCLYSWVTAIHNPSPTSCLLHSTLYANAVIGILLGDMPNWVQRKNTLVEVRRGLSSVTIVFGVSIVFSIINTI